jgi:hypothetical protein
MKDAMLIPTTIKVRSPITFFMGRRLIKSVNAIARVSFFTDSAIALLG